MHKVIITLRSGVQMNMQNKAFSYENVKKELARAEKDNTKAEFFGKEDDGTDVVVSINPKSIDAIVVLHRSDLSIARPQIVAPN